MRLNTVIFKLSIWLRRSVATALAGACVLGLVSCGGGGGGSVPVDPGAPTKWTVLVYLNAANDLYPFSTLNVNQMESVASNPNVRFVVQWKQDQNIVNPGSAPPTFDGTRRYLVKPDQTSAIASTLVQNLGQSVDMGLPSSLNSFIQWGKANYPADRYVLVIWNHGNGWQRSRFSDQQTRGVSYDDQTGNAIQTWQLNQALAGNKFDIVAFDASLMQMIEVAYEMRTKADFIAGSEESPPGEGYPYQRVFAGFRDNPDASTLALSKNFVDGMLAEPSYTSRKITQSVLDTTKLSAVASAASGFANALNSSLPTLATAIQDARSATQSFSLLSNRFYYDAINFTTNLDARTTDPRLLAASSAFRTTVQNAVVWEGHNSRSPGSRGLGIDMTPGAIYGTQGPDYSSLLWAQDTTWDSWLANSP